MPLTKIDDRGLTTPIDLLDNEKIQLGTGNDLQIYHDGTHSRIDEVGTGNLMIQTDNSVFIKKGTSENIAKFNVDGAVELYYNNSKKLETTSGGVLATGDFDSTTGIFERTSGFTSQLKFNSSNETQLIHGSNGQVKLSFIGTGSAARGSIDAQSSFIRIKTATDETGVICRDDSSTDLYFDGSKKLETYSNGIQVTGNILTTTGDISCASDSQKITAGASDDLEIYHDGTDSRIHNGTGSLVFRTGTNYIFYNSDASEKHAQFLQNGAVELYHDNGKVFETGSSEVKTERRIQIHADGPGSGHGMSIGQWDGSNHRIEGDANRPMVITAYNSGGIKMGVSGANKVAVNSHGLVFNGDTAAANALDDYEEGTFTPSFGFHNDNFSGTYSAQGGSYTKVGNTVNCRFQIAATKGSTTQFSGNATVYNLPFNCVNTDNYRASGVMGYYEGFGIDRPIIILLEANQNQFPLRHSGNADASSIGPSNISSSFRFYISVTYQVA